MSRSDRQLALGIFAVVLLVFSYFFQGDGWTLQANWLTIRAIVEHHTFEITPLADRTGDTAVYLGHIFSNKPPGLALAGVVPYWLAFHFERLCNVDPLAPSIEWINIRAITILLCALPGSIVAVGVFIWLRRENLSASLSAAMSLAFAFGSIFWPYSGMLFNHLLVAACFFGAWVIVETELLQYPTLFVASTLLGWAVLSEYLIAPMAIALVAFDFLKHHSSRRAICLLAGPVVAGVALLIYQHALFGSAFTPSYAYEARDIAADAAIRGRFSWPEWRRLYWVTFHRFRGLFYACPMFVASLLALTVQRVKWLSRASAFALLVIAYHLMFLLTYRFWSGGSGVGPRFAIPALPFLFCLSVAAFKRFPWIVWPLTALSVFNMLVVCGVQANYPANESGPPQQWDPVGVCTLWFFSNRLAVTPHSSNLGMTLGLRGHSSIVPVLLIVCLSLIGCLVLRRSEQRRRQSPLSSRIT